MAESMPFAKPPEPLEILMGNPAHSWGKWKQKFEIYLKAIGASKKPDEMKVGLLLNKSASFQPISMSKQLETNLPLPARKTITS